MEISLADKHFTQKQTIVTALYNVVDPELYVNIIDLGLVYNIDIDDSGKITITITLSTPHCPLEEAIKNGIHNALEQDFPGSPIEVIVVWEPAWNFSMMTEEGKAQLGMG